VVVWANLQTSFPNCCAVLLMLRGIFSLEKSFRFFKDAKILLNLNAMVVRGIKCISLFQF
jgi:hypothetical protein